MMLGQLSSHMQKDETIRLHYTYTTTSSEWPKRLERKTRSHKPPEGNVGAKPLTAALATMFRIRL